MPEPSESDSLAHEWVVAATIPVSPELAKYADFRGSYRIKGGTRVDAVDVMCAACRCTYEKVADQPCQAKISNEHLIGGDLSVRAKRKIPPQLPNATVVPGPPINRRGYADGYSVHH